MRRFHMFAGFATLALVVGLYGCASEPDQSSPTQPAGGEQANQDPDADAESHEGHGDMHEGHGDMDEGHGGGDMEKMKEGLAELSEEDRAAAKKQHICPVSGKMLGTMGAPIKVTVKDQDVWICCGGCEETFTGDPDKYLAKLKEEE